MWLDIPDLAISFLATKSQQPTDADDNNALRVLAYLKSTLNYGIIIQCTELKLHLHCDASWASPHDGNSHAGWILKMVKSYLGCKSGKQRVGSPSFTDAEIIAISDALRNWKWMDNLLGLGLGLGLAYPNPPSKLKQKTQASIEQDNFSTAIPY